MSNVLTGNPLVIDTAGSGIIISREFTVTAIVWDAGQSASANDVAVVTDKTGALKWQGSAAAKNSNLNAEFPKEIHFSGLIVPTLDAGTLLIYTAQGAL